MQNVIILGSGGRAGEDIHKKLNVPKDYAFPFKDKVLLANEINEKVDEVGVVNWIGHGYPRWLNVPGGQVEPDEAGTLIELLNLHTTQAPKSKIVLWACNTGLLIAEGALSERLWQEYKGSKEYRQTPAFQAYAKTKEYTQSQYKVDKYKTFASLRVELKNSEVGAKQITQSVAYRIAKKMSSHGISVYAPAMGLQPGAISSFDMPQGPGNMVQWEAQSGNDPITMGPARKWGFIAVSEETSKVEKLNEKTGETTVNSRRTMRFICKYDKSSTHHVFTYYSLYVDL